MKRIASAMAVLVVFGTAGASAQPGWGPDRGYWIPDRGPMFQDERTYPGPMRPRRVARIVRSLGLDPVGPAVRQGAVIVQPAATEDGRAMRVAINIDSGAVVSVTPVRARDLPRGAPYGVSGPVPGPYAHLGPYDDDFGPYPPGAMPPGGRMPPSADVSPYPPPVIEGPKKKSKSATVTPDRERTPVPRKRPAGAETATTKSEPGSVAPLPQTQAAPPATQGDAPQPSAAPAPSPAKPDLVIPPVSPLE